MVPLDRPWFGHPPYTVHGLKFDLLLDFLRFQPLSTKILLIRLILGRTACMCASRPPIDELSSKECGNYIFNILC
jgi:hypothetical protein